MEDQVAKDHHYMQLALAEAESAYALAEVPIGALIVSQDQIIARTHNLVQHQQDATAHAEMRAFQAACAQKKAKYLTDCTLYVTLEPCPMCAMASHWLQLARIVFAAHDPKKGYQLVPYPLLHPRTQVTSGILAHKSEACLQQFFQALRTTKKPLA
ncbi:MAG: nucleoside deaminase [Bacteroidota bacterium]